MAAAEFTRRETGVLLEYAAEMKFVTESALLRDPAEIRSASGQIVLRALDSLGLQPPGETLPEKLFYRKTRAGTREPELGCEIIEPDRPGAAFAQKRRDAGSAFVRDSRPQRLFIA